MPESLTSETETQELENTGRRGIAPALVLLALIGASSLTGFWMTRSGPFASDTSGPAEARDADVSGAPAEPSSPPTTGHDTATDSDDPGSIAMESPLAPKDAECSRLIVGVWEQERFGTRRMTVLDDGTASMAIRPSGIWASMFGEKIDLEMFWSIKDGHIDYGVSGGSPEEQMETARKMWGDHWVEKIETLTQDELILIDQSTSAPSRWTRAKEDETQG